MMKISLSLLFLLTWTLVCSQQERMVNGGFEDIDLTIPYPGYDFAVEYASPWKSIYGSADACHPDIPINFGGIPHQGEGIMRLGHLLEYAQGKTMNLVAGTTYEISFWGQVRFMSPFYSRNLGMMIGTTDFSNGFDPLTDFEPQLLIQPSSNWTTGSYCFTAQTSGVHYVVIGGLCDPIPGSDANYFMFDVDDVSVKELTNNTGVPTAGIVSTQTEFCKDNIVLDGSVSSNETGYHWVIEQRLPDGKYMCLYTQNEQNGQAGVFNVNNAFASVGHTPGFGGCYRAYLYTSNQCEVRDRLDFCIVNPNVFFITDGSPVCENLPVDLQVTGDNGWTYTWSSGQSSVGLKTVSVTPTIGNSTYTVTVTTPEGCTSTKTITLVVNSQNNVAPWMDGINGTGEYTYYVSQGDAVFFNSLLSNDHQNELIEISTSSTIPSGFLANPPTSWGSIFSLSWATSLATPTGEYHYTLTVSDRNSCNEGVSTFVFRIIVVCDQCPVCVSYEDRTPSGTPLPAETKAGKCIRAGFSETVSTGDANVTFIAGVSIEHGSFWDAGPGYYGYIEPTTCVTDCEDCCNDWAGFTIDNAYYQYINLWDSDPTNDYFELTDVNHPFCAYGAKRFSLYILDSDNQQEYYHLEGGGYECCMLRSRAPENPIPHSSIFWDVHYGGHAAAAQYYIAKVILYDCNDLPHDFYFSLNVTFLSGMAQNNSDSVGQVQNTLNLNNVAETGSTISDSTTIRNEELGIYPNPATNMLYISGSRAETTTIQIYDEKGSVLTKREKVALNQGYNLEAFSSGKYYCRIYKDDGSYLLKEFIKL